MDKKIIYAEWENMEDFIDENGLREDYEDYIQEWKPISIEDQWDSYKTYLRENGLLQRCNIWNMERRMGATINFSCFDE